MDPAASRSLAELTGRQGSWRQAVFCPERNTGEAYETRTDVESDRGGAGYDGRPPNTWEKSRIELARVYIGRANMTILPSRATELNVFLHAGTERVDGGSGIANKHQVGGGELWQGHCHSRLILARRRLHAGGQCKT